MDSHEPYLLDPPGCESHEPQGPKVFMRAEQRYQYGMIWTGFNLHFIRILCIISKSDIRVEKGTFLLWS